MTFLEVVFFLSITCLITAGAVLVAYELHGTAKDIAAAIADKPPVTINIDSNETLAELAQARAERDQWQADYNRVRGDIIRDARTAETALATANSEVQRLNLELANFRDVSSSPLTSLKIHRGDYLASSVRGLLLHAGLVRTGGEAHARAARGEVAINASVITDVEADATKFLDLTPGHLMFALRCGSASCAVTVTP